MDRRAIGRDAERAAEQYLLRQGFKSLERNQNYRTGELDLIMLDNTDLVFIEVRQRNSNRYGGAVESVDYRKQRKLIKAASLWLLSHPRYQYAPCRFDVIAIDSSSDPARFMWYKDAFRPE